MPHVRARNHLPANRSVTLIGGASRRRPAGGRGGLNYHSPGSSIRTTSTTGDGGQQGPRSSRIGVIERGMTHRGTTSSSAFTPSQDSGLPVSTPAVNETGLFLARAYPLLDRATAGVHNPLAQFHSTEHRRGRRAP